MRAGKLRKRVAVQTPIRTQNAIGEDVPTYAAPFMRWAAIEPLEGREAEIAQGVQPIATHKITMRDDGQVTPETRIVWNSRTFNIVEVRRIDERGHEMQLTAREEV